jgi:hypothetical protein
MQKSIFFKIFSFLPTQKSFFRYLYNIYTIKKGVKMDKQENTEIEVIPFDYGDNLVRTISENGEFFWVAKDVCDILGYKEVPKTLTKLDADEKDTKIIRTLGGNQKMSVINESGLYSLISLDNIVSFCFYTIFCIWFYCFICLAYEL